MAKRVKVQTVNDRTVCRGWAGRRDRRGWRGVQGSEGGLLRLRRPRGALAGSKFPKPVCERGASGQALWPQAEKSSHSRNLRLTWWRGAGGICLSSDISRGSPNPTRRQGVREPGEAVPWGEEQSEDGGSVREPPVQPEGAGDKQWWLTKMRKCSGSLRRPCVQE